jgi:septal ring factor EnvC (AmiA/AmiB activator)
LDQQKLDIDKKYEQKVKELDECRLVIVQIEAKIKSQQEYIKDLEAKKRKLEDDLDASNEEIAKIKAAGLLVASEFLKVKLLRIPNIFQKPRPTRQISRLAWLMTSLARHLRNNLSPILNS